MRGGAKLRAAIYDGDTEAERRWQIRKWANVILTNPDMLHVGVLPHHDRWGDVLSNLAYVIVDEAHVYRGVFGSHVANVLRRLWPRGAADRSDRVKAAQSTNERLGRIVEYAPAEELFWRGFVQRRLARHMNRCGIYEGLKTRQLYLS